ncbi:MAG: hypothetical protein GXO85_11830, partial [Chlorobi bacterium]|nr:hypothetical protein [Chlorobiota bacterium]
MKIVLLIILIVMTTAAHCQSTASKAVDNEITPEHVSVKGTKVSLIPPADWQSAKGFNGFQQSEISSSIIVAEIHAPFSEVTKGFTEEQLKLKGVILKEKIDVTVNGLEGVFLKANQSAYKTEFNKLILAFGDSANSIVINGIFPAEYENSMGGKVEKSIFSVVYEADRVIDPLANLSFEIDIRNSKFKLAKVVSNMAIYNTDGLLPTQSSDKTSLYIGSSFGENKITNREEYSLSRLNG